MPIPTDFIIESIQCDIKTLNLCYKNVDYNNLFLTCTLCENKIHVHYVKTKYMYTM